MQANIFKIQKSSRIDGPGMRTAIYFQGCPLRCRWCPHPDARLHPHQILWDSRKCFFCHLCELGCPTDSLYFRHNKLEFTADTCNGCLQCIEQCPTRGIHFVEAMVGLEDVMREILADRSLHSGPWGVTLSGGEPLMQADFAAALLRECRKEGIHTALETSCYSTPLIFSRLLAETDLLFLTLKHHSNRHHVNYTGVPLRPILDNLDFALSMGVPVTVRITVMAGINDSPYDAQQFAALLSEHRVKEVELMTFHQMGQKKYEEFHTSDSLQSLETLRPDGLSRYADIMRSFGLKARLHPVIPVPTK